MKKLLIIFLCVGLVFAGIGLYLYYKPVKNLAHVMPDYTAYTPEEVEVLFKKINENPDKYIGNIIEFQWIVNEITTLPSGGGYLLMELDRPKVFINAQLDHRVNASTVQSGEACKVRAEFTGMEEDLIDPEVHILYFKQTTIINF